MPFLTPQKPPGIGPQNLKNVDEPAKDRQPPSIDEVTVESRVPVVRLDVDAISDAVAARLATSLLGHVLYLKNQVPFPVAQLGRLPGGNANTRAAKQRAELLASFDTLSSHLDTTFTALSTAFARCQSSSLSSDSVAKGLPKSGVARAYLAILVGPSLSTPKSKVILTVDGLDARIWGQREDNGKPEEEDGEVDEEANDDGDEDEDDDDDHADSHDQEEPEDSDDDDEDVGEPDSDTNSDEEEDTPPPSPPPYISHAEEQRFLNSADRLLSRTLAGADAESYGLSAELSPTQTHILIRAPRRFAHPAWIPRQNASNSLEAVLHEFLDESLQRKDTDAISNQKSRSMKQKKGKPEGVWLTCRDGINPDLTLLQDALEQGSNIAEDDEMIWWSWDGKLVGFSDW